MPEGPLGGHRPFGLGPFTKEEDTTYIYRGGDTDTIREQVIQNGIIPGDGAYILNADPVNPSQELKGETKLEEIEWKGQQPQLPNDLETVPVTGGMTHHIPATRRFRGSRGVVAVFDASKTPFEKVEYEYEWFNKHPGALTQVLSRSYGELHTSDVGLWASLHRSPKVRGGYTYSFDYWTPDNLPATSPNSKFAEEREWIAMESPVSVSRAFEGIVFLTTERSTSIYARSEFDDIDDLRDASTVAPRVYEDMASQLGRFREPFYMLVFRGDNIPDKTFYDGGRIEMAYSDNGEVQPDEVPTKFRGNT